jgi:hypothetical protein
VGKAVVHSQVDTERRREQTTVDLGADKTGIVSHLIRAVLDALKSLIRVIDKTSTSQREKNALKRCYSTLVLWADGHGVWTGRLDGVLKRSQSLQATTLSILTPMCKILLHGMSLYPLVLSLCSCPSEVQKKAPLSPDDSGIDGFCTTFAEIYGQAKSLLVGLEMSNDDSDNDSGSDSDVSEEDSQETRANSAIDDLKMYTNCLVDLGTALECPAVDPEHVRETRAVRLEPLEAHDYYTKLIEDKFRGVSPHLAECLGKVNWGRYQRMQREREINAKTPALVDDQAKSHTASSEFQDSGLGTSIPAAHSAYAATVISFMTSMGGGNRVPIPPLSTEAKKGSPFECNACGKLIRATTNRDWRWVYFP